MGVSSLQGTGKPWLLWIAVVWIALWGLTPEVFAQGDLLACRTDIPIVIDGHLSDLPWQLAENLVIDDTTPATWLEQGTFTVDGPRPKGPGDAALRMKALWNEDYLYIALDVIDDSVVTDQIVGSLREQDSVEIVIDPSGTGAERRALIFALETAAGNGPWFSIPGARIGAVLKLGGAVGQIRPLGYTAEIAIPLAAFAKAYNSSIAPGQAFGLEVRLNDVDYVPDPGGEGVIRQVRRMTWTGNPMVMEWGTTPQYGTLHIVPSLVGR